VSAASSLLIEAHVEVVETENRSHPWLFVRFMNKDDGAIAFTETFGFGAYSWIGIRIMSSDGSTVDYPVDVDLFSSPESRCLGPGQAIDWKIDLLSWRIQTGGEWGGSGEVKRSMPLTSLRAGISCKFSMLTTE